MKFKFFNLMHENKTQSLIPMPKSFQTIAWSTFIVYFISFFIGWFNFIFAYLSRTVYIPLESYITVFNLTEVTNHKGVERIYDLTGFKEIINSTIPYKLIDDIFYLVICFLVIFFFYAGYKYISKNDVDQTEILKWSIIFSVLMTFSIPNNSSDIYGYIARGTQQIIYNQNPYFETVNKIQDYSKDPLLCNFMWPKTPTTYGPIFIYLTELIVWLSHNDFFTSFLNFKLLNLTIYFLLLYFLAKTNESKNLFLIAWNPFIMFHGLWNGHNDVICGFLIFLGLYFLKKENFFTGIFTLTCAIGVKYLSVLALPLIFIYLFKKGFTKEMLSDVIIGFLCGLIMILIFSVDYFSLSSLLKNDTGKLLQSISLVHQSGASVIVTLGKYFANWFNFDININLFTRLTQLSFYLIFLIFYLYSFFLILKNYNLIFVIILTMFIFLAFILTKFHSWYLLNIAFLFPLLDEKIKQDVILKNIIIVLLLMHCFSITFIDQAKILNFTFMTFIPTLIILCKNLKGLKT